MHADTIRLLTNWHNEINCLSQAHYDTSIRKKRMNYLVGIPLIMLEILIASYMIFTISQEPTMKLKMIVGALVIVAAILAALQTFLKYSEQAEDHRNAQARFRNLMISIDQVLALPPRDEHALVEWCDKFRERWNEVSIDAPVVSKWLLRAKQARLQKNGENAAFEPAAEKTAVNGSQSAETPPPAAAEPT